MCYKQINKILVLVSCFCFITSLKSQDPTIGLLHYSDEMQEGYTLLAPSLSSDTYLIDNCGKVVNTWDSNFRPGAVAYLLENGNLLRTGTVGGTFSGGGRGGIVESYNWEGELIWSYRVADESQHQHHDVEYLPNGNILVLAWEKISVTEAMSKGIRWNLTSEGLWPDKVMELKPIGIDSAEIVWEWRVWDHVVQDVDPTSDNFGEISEHPELIDVNLNFLTNQIQTPDWNHCNAIDYNAELDQIMLSSRNFSEVWIIDHSTTTEEASSHEGGNSGKGGDILYRWGNPANYDNGTTQDQKFFGQHDAHWIEHGIDKGKIIVFNNAQERGYSSADIIDPQIDENGNYVLSSNDRFWPEDLFWTYDKFNGGFQFASSRISSADRLPNGNTLITSGQNGYIWEINEMKETVWIYQNPVANQPLTQGSSANGTAIFRSYKYPKTYPAFEGKTITSGEPIEVNPIENSCADITSSNEVVVKNNINVYPNPVRDVVRIELTDVNTEVLQKGTIIEIYNLNGQKVKEIIWNSKSILLDISFLEKGFYFLNISNSKKNVILSKNKIVKI